MFCSVKFYIKESRKMFFLYKIANKIIVAPVFFTPVKIPRPKNNEHGGLVG